MLHYRYFSGVFSAFFNRFFNRRHSSHWRSDRRHSNFIGYFACDGGEEQDTDDDRFGRDRGYEPYNIFSVLPYELIIDSYILICSGLPLASCSPTSNNSKNSRNSTLTSSKLNLTILSYTSEQLGTLSANSLISIFSNSQIKIAQFKSSKSIVTCALKLQDIIMSELNLSLYFACTAMKF